MLLIANNCVGGYLYKYSNCKYNNPFMWCMTPYTSMEHIMLNYHDINWYDVKLYKNDDPANTFSMIIDNTIAMHFGHIKLNTKYQTPTKIGNDIFYKFAYKYVVNKYFARLARMLNSDETPFFVVHDETYKNASYDINTVYKHTGHLKNTLFISSKLNGYDAPNIYHMPHRERPSMLVAAHYEKIMNLISPKLT